MSKYRYHTYDGYDHILSEVRYLIKTYVPADHTKKVLDKIDYLEVSIEETLSGRQDQYEQAIKEETLAGRQGQYEQSIKDDFE